MWNVPSISPNYVSPEISGVAFWLQVQVFCSFYIPENLPEVFSSAVKILSRIHCHTDRLNSYIWALFFIFFATEISYYFSWFLKGIFTIPTHLRISEPQFPILIKSGPDILLLSLLYFCPHQFVVHIWDHFSYLFMIVRYFFTFFTIMAIRFCSFSYESAINWLIMEGFQAPLG